MGLGFCFAVYNWKFIFDSLLTYFGFIGEENPINLIPQLNENIEALRVHVLQQDLVFGNQLRLIVVALNEHVVILQALPDIQRHLAQIDAESQRLFNLIEVQRLQIERINARIFDLSANLDMLLMQLEGAEIAVGLDAAVAIAGVI